MLRNKKVCFLITDLDLESWVKLSPLVLFTLSSLLSSSDSLITTDVQLANSYIKLSCSPWNLRPPLQSHFGGCGVRHNPHQKQNDKEHYTEKDEKEYDVKNQGDNGYGEEDAENHDVVENQDDVQN